MYLGLVHKAQNATWESRIVERSVFFPHPSFNRETHSNDVGLVYLANSMPGILSSPYIDTINLPTLSDTSINLVGMQSIVSGFGSTGGIFMSDFLNFVEMRIVDNQYCNEAFPSLVSIANVCTETDAGNSPCIGDEGKQQYFNEF